MVKIVKHNKTLLYMKLRPAMFDPQELERDPVLGAIADALQWNTTLQKFEVASYHDHSQHQAFTLDKRLLRTKIIYFD